MIRKMFPKRTMARRVERRKRKLWSAMTREERRVAIAKDVLDWIETDEELLHLERGSYFAWLHGDKPDMPKDNNTLLDEEFGHTLIRHCEVCAMGALFAVRVTEYQDLTAGVLDLGEYGHDVGDEAILKGMGDCFSPQQLRVIERVFEDDQIDLSPKEVMRRIMQRIVDQKGKVDLPVGWLRDE